jgi:hypothetical protein
MSMKNSNDTIGNRIRDLPVCSTVPQPTAPPRAPVVFLILKIKWFYTIETQQQHTIISYAAVVFRRNKTILF